MPAGEQRDAVCRGQCFQVFDLADRGSGRFFQENMFFRFQRCPRGVIAELRRHAERYGLELRHGVEHRLDGWEIRDVVHLAVPAGGGDEAVGLVLRQGRQMLVADDLSYPDDAELDGVVVPGHGRLRGLEMNCSWQRWFLAENRCRASGRSLPAGCRDRLRFRQTPNRSALLQTGPAPDWACFRLARRR